MRPALSVFGSVLRNRELLPLQAAFAGFQAAEFAVWVAMLVYAFEQGGTTTAAVVAVIQLVPSALFAPIAGALADKYPAGRVLAAGYLALAVSLAATAVALLSGAPPALAYALSAIAATTVTITRPTQAVLLPAISRTPDELTAANVFTGWIETGMALAGPAIAGVLLAVGSAGLVFAVFAAVMFVSTLLVARIAFRAEPPPRDDESVSASAREELVAGFQAVLRSPPTRVLVLLLALGYLVWGAFDVLAVVLAIDVLDLGNSGAGYLTAAFGAGSIIGAMGAVALVGRRRLVPALFLAAALWGGSFAAVGFSASTALAFGLLVVAGVGQSLLELAGRTLLQRISPPDVLARVFGVYEGMTMVALALGSIIVPPLVAAGGAKLAFLVVGAALPVFAVLASRSLIAVDAAATVPIVQIALLRATRIFGALPPPALEGVAHNLEPVEAPAGTVIIRQGDVGDRYYVIADGEVEVTIDETPVARRTRSDGVGEIALLRDVPRTATVTATTHTRLYALDRDAFLVAVTGHAPAHDQAMAVVREHSVEPI